jgi:hypothetical protein
MAPCKCGGTDHQRISSKKCPLNRANIINHQVAAPASDSEEPSTTTDRDRDGNINAALDATNR